jgi:hypothetical protein
LLGGIVYWADQDHWAAWGEPDQICSAGWSGEALSPKDRPESPGIAVELVLDVVGDLFWIG